MAGGEKFEGKEKSSYEYYLNGNNNFSSKLFQKSYNLISSSFEI